MPDSPSRRLRDALSSRILVLDGAYGTLLQGLGLDEAAYRGTLLEDHPCNLAGNHDVLALTCPDVVRDAHERYLAAGADIVQTNTFSSTRIAQADYQLEDRVPDMNAAAARVARAFSPTSSEAVTRGRRRPGRGRRLRDGGPAPVRRRRHRPDQPHREPVPRRQRSRLPQRVLRDAGR